MTLPTYHIVWTTYGTWLPGDARGWVKKHTPGIQEPDPQRERQARHCMVESPVLLTPTQRAIVEQTIHEHARIRKWVIHALNVRSNHVHIVVMADHDAKDVMNQFKAWCSRKLSDAAGLEYAVAHRAGRRRWFTEGGDVKLIRDETYLETAIQYVLERQ